MNLEKIQFENYSRKRDFFEYKDTYSGFLWYKSSGFISKWGKRFFQLRGNILFHYINKKAEIAKNMTFLEDIRVQKIDLSGQKKNDLNLKFGFSIEYYSIKSDHQKIFYLYLKKLGQFYCQQIMNKREEYG